MDIRTNTGGIYITFQTFQTFNPYDHLPNNLRPPHLRTYHHNLDRTGLKTTTDTLQALHVPINCNQLNGYYAAIKDGLWSEIKVCKCCGLGWSGLLFIKPYKQANKLYQLRRTCLHCENLRVNTANARPYQRSHIWSKGLYVIRYARRLGCSIKEARQRIKANGRDKKKGYNQKGGVRALLNKLKRR